MDNSGLEYIRKTYQVPAYVGARVRYTGGNGPPIDGTITRSHGALIRVRFDGHRHSVNLHPKWEVEYLPLGKNGGSDG